MTEVIAETRRERRPDRSRTKAIIAIAAGAVLLLGGGTTLAYWTTTQTITGGAISSGDLNLATTGTPTWWLTAEGSSTPVDITAALATTKIVPGDTVTLTQDATLTLVGDNMNATLSIAGGAAPTGFTAAPITATKGGTALPAELVPSDSGAIEIEAQFVFNPDVSTDTRNLVNTASTLADVTLTLTQVAP